MRPGLFMILNCLLITSAASIQTQALGSSSPKQKPSYLNSSQSPELAEATRLNTLVAALYRQGEYDKALPLAKRVLTIREKSLGPDHWLVAESLRDLAEVLSALGKHQEAINTYQRFLITFEKTVEAYGPGMIEVLERYICLLMDDGSKDSKPEAALEIQKRLYKLENGFDFDQSDNSPVKKLAKSGLLISKHQVEQPAVSRRKNVAADFRLSNYEGQTG